MTSVERPAGERAAVDGVRRVRRHREVRHVTVSLALAGLCFGLCCVALAFGEISLPILDIVRALVGGGDPNTVYIVNELRLPRVVVGVLAGSAFGLAGAILQTLVRNPLASPDIIGITAGASAAAVFALLEFGLRGFPVSVAAFAGGLVTAAVIYTLAWRDGVTGYRLVLIGIGMTAMLTSVISYALTRAEVYAARDAVVWLTGSLNAMSWATAKPLGFGVAVLIPPTLLAGRWLAALQLGDGVARSLGVPVERARLGLVVLAVALAAVATAAVGPVAFVAFVAGPIARRLAGPHSGAALLPAALIGAVVLTAADVAAQNALDDVQLPVGVVTALIGGPYLLWLLATNGKR